MTRAALYLRVSTEDQTEENQAPELRQLAERRGWTPVEYRETASGAAKVRPVLDQLMADAKAGKVGAVVVWALDRLSRQGAGPVLNMVGELDRVGVALVSVREPWLDTAGPFRDVIVSLCATFARLERERLIERTCAALGRVAREEATAAGRERRRAAGKKAIGRPRASTVLLCAAADLVAAGTSVRAAARAKGVKEATLRRFLRTNPAEGQAEEVPGG